MIDDGGPAFPRTEHRSDGSVHFYHGMSLRDWLAGQSLAGMSARDSFDPGQSTPEQRARLAYMDADAALAVRKERRK